MSNFVSALLVLALFLPAFLPLAPHETVHAMYDANIMHQAGTSHNEAHHEKFHSEGQCLYTDHERSDHHIPTDPVSYYSEFLHIDLKNTDYQDLISKIDTSKDFDYDLGVLAVRNSLIELKSLQKRGPPSGYVNNPVFTPIYLTTQSLLI